MGDYAVIFLGACLVNNLVLDTMLGLPPAIAVSKKIAIALAMTLTMLLALSIATVITYPLYYYVLIPFNLNNLQTFSFILCITLGIKCGESLIRRFKPELYEKIAVFIPLTLINSAALGIALINVQVRQGVFGSLIFGLGSAVGFGLIIIAMSAMQERIMDAEIPAPFQGIAIILITLGIMSMAFMGFAGIVNL